MAQRITISYTSVHGFSYVNELSSLLLSAVDDICQALWILNWRLIILDGCQGSEEFCSCDARVCAGQGHKVKKEISTATISRDGG